MRDSSLALRMTYMRLFRLRHTFSRGRNSEWLTTAPAVESMRKTVRRLVLFIAFILMIGLAAIAGAAESKPSWQREWEKILDGAKKEGEVRLWGEQEITHPDVIAAFNKEYPSIKAVTVSGRVGDLMPRIIAERRAGKFFADI